MINSSPSIGKYTNKHELYRKLTPRRVNDTNTNKIESYTCVRNFMTVTPVLNTGIEKWGAGRIF